MRFLSVLFPVLICSIVNAQDLRNTEWIKIKAERKDGSKIIDRNDRGTGPLHYYFLNDSIHISADMQYSTTQNYSLNNDTLSIGNLINYHVDSLNDVFMGVTEIPREALTDDKINSYVFVNADYIYDYLVKTNKMRFTPDSIIDYNDYFFPTYEGETNRLFVSKFDYPGGDESLNGSIMILGNGIVKNVSIMSEKNFSDRQIKNITDILTSTSGSWVMPPSPKLFKFKLNFLLEVSHFGKLYGTRFSLQRKDTLPLMRNLTNIEKNEAGNHFNKGLRLAKNGKFDKAVAQFQECIREDASYLDAYYDLAYSYQRMGNKELACETWERLKNMQQKKGEALYNENCK